MSIRRHLAHVGANLCAFNTGTAVTNLRVAVTARIKDGQWRDGDTSFSRSTSGAARPSTADSLPRATGSWSSAGSGQRSWETPRESSGRWPRSRPTSRGQPEVGTAKVERTSQRGNGDRPGPAAQAVRRGDFNDTPPF